MMRWGVVAWLSSGLKPLCGVWSAGLGAVLQCVVSARDAHIDEECQKCGNVSTLCWTVMGERQCGAGAS